jgi:hypothetical protein
MEHHTAGDPISGLKWTHKTTKKISHQLRKAGLNVSAKTVARLLKGLKFSLRDNHKILAGKSSPYRNQQFEDISRMRRRFTAQGWPTTSIDTKKKERLGRFKNKGRSWESAPLAVNDHDFKRDSLGSAIPWALYETPGNRGYVFVGTSHDTPVFAVTALARWYELQTRFCNRFGIQVTICHYPSGTSKWNPIEHRLFSEISKNWAGQPLESYETLLNFIRTTKTKTGLVVKATLLPGNYPTGVKIPDTKMAQVCLRPHRLLPMWTYTLPPARSKM